MRLFWGPERAQLTYLNIVLESKNVKNVIDNINFYAFFRGDLGYC